MPTDSAPFVVPGIVQPPVVGPSTTVAEADLVARVRRLLLDEPYEDHATGTLDNVSEVINVNSPTSWAEGDIMEPRDNVFEMLKVRVGGGNPITVKRGHNDSAIGGHSVGVTLLKNPRFSGDEIGEGLTRVSYDMWPQAWDVETITITPVAGVQTYSLPDDVLDLVQVTQDITPTGTSNLLTFHYGRPNQGYPVLVQRQAPTTVSSTGLALYVPNLRSLLTPLTVTYRSLVTIAEVDEGLMADALVLGTVARVIGMRQIVRSGQDVRQGEPGMASVYLQDLAFFQGEYQRILRRLYLQLLDSSGPMPLWRL